ncbi:MAG: DUF1800 domain-containing protein [Oceanospirillaceae bacterium]|nr:DUF1800 domain-containing protein [Oceanospirillaceae bacterium]
MPKQFVIKFLSLLVLGMLGSNSWALSVEDNKHLLLRAGFGAKPSLLNELENLNRTQAIKYLLDEKSQFAKVPSCVNNKIPTRKMRKAYSKDQKKAAQKANRQCARSLKAWYLAQLIESDAVLANQMNLLWHNHFTSSLKKVKSVQLIYRQHQTIKQHALGDFSALLMAMVKDPAMLIYLDNVNNTKAKPNENLGRELLELFSLGEGNYGEADIVSASKALTGLGIDPVKYQSIVRKKRHDNSVKQIFDGTKIRSADDLVAAILAQPQTANYIVTVIWQHFISQEDPAQIQQLAKTFSKDWNIKALLGKILNSEQFWRDQGQMFKSPLELVAGSAQLFQGLKIPNKRMLGLMNQMGQNLFDPPNVKGWPKGKDWLDENKLVIRMNLSNQLARAISSNMAVMGAPYCTGNKITALSALPLPPPSESNNAMSSSCQKQLAKIVTAPSWQLK